MSGKEENDIEEWKTFIRNNTARIVLRLKISDRLITLLYSNKIMDEEDVEKLESISSTAKQQMEMLKMWANVPEKIPTLIAILKRDDFLLEPVAAILEEFGIPKPQPVQERHPTQPVLSEVKADTPGMPGERAVLPESRRKVTLDDTLPIDTPDSSAPKSTNSVSRQVGGIAGNDLIASRDIISQTTRGSHNQIGFNIRNAMFTSQVQPQLSFMNNMATNLTQQVHNQPMWNDSFGQESEDELQDTLY